MSSRNGDRARFRKDRLRKLLHRQRIRVLFSNLRKKAESAATNSATASAKL